MSFKKSFYGFTLIEIAIVILIMGLILTVGLPNLINKNIKNYEQFISNLNKVTLDGILKAESTNKVYKILINLINKKIELFLNSDKNNTSIESLSIPDSIEVIDFLIDNKSQFSSTTSERKLAYFLINSLGITQNCKILFKDNNLKNKNEYEVMLNPIIGQFSLS